MMIEPSPAPCRYSSRGPQSRQAIASARVLVAIAVVALTMGAGGARSDAQPHEPNAAPAPGAASAQPDHAAPAQGQQPAGEHPAADDHARGEGEEHGSVWQIIAKLFNFAVLVGVLVHYLKTPVANYLASRSTQIRQDLVTAAETRATASAELAEIERRLKSLPAELEALKAQGAEDVTAEKIRIAHAATVERERLLDQTRREIAMRLRVARRELVDLAADLTVKVARTRVQRAITPEDQIRLVDRYMTELGQQKEAR